MDVLDQTSLVSDKTVKDSKRKHIDTLCERDLDGTEKDSTTFMKAAKACFSIEDLSGSVAYLQRYLTLNETDTTARARLIFLLKKLENFKEASTQLTIMQELTSIKNISDNQRLEDFTNHDKYDEALDFLEKKLEKFPNHFRLLIRHGDILKTLGRVEEAEISFKQASIVKPLAGMPYWSLANLKSYRFSEKEIALMQSTLIKSELTDNDRALFNYALGKALEDNQQYSESFKHYTHANKIKAKTEPYYKEGLELFYQATKAGFTKDYFVEKGRTGFEGCAPIFIVGLPRSGSTLTEQILASHSQVDGTRELGYIFKLARNLYMNKKFGKDTRDIKQLKIDSKIPFLPYADLMANFNTLEYEMGGRYYDEKTMAHRQGAPFFTDKLPNNFMHIGLIHQILPNAKIIDVRRNPMSVGLSVFRQSFPKGLSFSNDLNNFADFYQRYLDIMKHWDEVLPGKVHHLSYETLVQNPEQEIRQLLDYCELPFEEGCLNFHETKRSIKTPSAEQVKQPMYTDSIEQWKNYESELGELKVALGDAVIDYKRV